MRRPAGSTLAEMMVSCLLFTLFMTVTLGLFHSMTKIVRREQLPAERLSEGRMAVLSVARRLRDSYALARPTLRELLIAPTDALYVRSLDESRTVEYRVQEQVLRESHHGFRTRPWLDDTPPLKGCDYATPALFRVVSGGFAFPTRVTVEIVLTDGRQLQAVSNFREAI